MSMCHIFVGPTGFGVLGAIEIPLDVELREPACRGDIDALLGHLVSGDQIVLVDGIFGRETAVGHKELLRAVDIGVPVWGLGSMGAIRACELDRYGMKGYGVVYRQFATNSDFGDDEVALTHYPIPPYEPVSEPLIHLREVVAKVVRDGLLSLEASAQIVNLLKRTWFANRTLTLLSDLLQQFGVGEPQAAAAIAQIGSCRLKQSDLRSFIVRRAWSAEGPDQ